MRKLHLSFILSLSGLVMFTIGQARITLFCVGDPQTCWSFLELTDEDYDAANQSCVNFVNSHVANPITSCTAGNLSPPEGLPWLEAGWFWEEAERTFYFGKFYFGVCPEGTHPDANFLCLPDEDDQAKQCPMVQGNPINTATGNKYHSETIEINNQLSFDLSYNSNFRYTGNGIKDIDYLGLGWMHQYNASISKIYTVGSDRTVFVNRPNGRQFRFNEVNGIWTPSEYVKDSLQQNGHIWTYKTADNTVETYNTGYVNGSSLNVGRLESVKTSDGKETVISYISTTQGVKPKIDRITGPFGGFIDFT
ncbi:hypothetical protein MNBD_GAMMA02-174, partial [hydrothermal vent metagenome]